ncbi:MAG: hypothetical protein Q4D61_07990 [Cardiobacteriaceae bacterium]|nr:hypothetical protein [Cardiobacteriaceae bacterium]
MKKLLAWLAFCGIAFAQEAALYNPARHVFIAGTAIPSIAVVDLNAGKQIDSLKIPVAAKVFAASTDSPYLAFSDRVDRAVYTVNLKNRDTTRHPLPGTVYRIIFIPNSSKMLLVLFENLAVLDAANGKVEIIPRTFQSLYTRYNIIFSVYSRTVWVLQENTPLIHRYNLNKPQEGWSDIDIGDTRGFGLGAPSFEDKVIAFNTYYADEGIIYFNDSGRVIKTGKMHDSRSLNQPMVEPYIDNATRHVIFGDKRGNLKIYRLDESDEPQEYQISFPPNRFRTGWMDQYLIVAGDEAIGIYPFDDMDNGTVIPFGYEENVNDVWVSGDSKYLLFGTARSNKLGVFDLQKQQRLPDIPLSGIAEVGRIRMNTANTVCY